MMRSRALAPLLAVAALFLAVPGASPAAAADPAPAASFPPQDPLPVDPGVRIGHLDNGLTYYIRANHKPEDRAELRLVVNAGSVLEKDDQQGLAHFVEHMAFNGTEHFKAGELVSFLESIGIRFGADLNAYTSFDETVYMLEVPTDKPGLLDRGMLVLADWAHALSFDPEEVEKERGVVLEEWRLGQGASERIRQVQWPVLLKGSRYAERLPIGKPDIIEHAPVDRIRDFYTTWYRPGLQAVVAVGAFDPDSVETMIRDRFGSIPARENPEPRPEFDVPPQKDMLAVEASDREMPYTQVSVTFKHGHRDETTVADYRRTLVNQLFSSMLNARLAEIAKEPDAPFLYAGSGSGSLVRTEDMFQVFAATPDTGMTRGLGAVMTEIARVRAHGFGAGELDRAKERMRAGLEQAYQERNKTESSSYVREYTSNFLEKEPIPGIEYEYRLAGTLLDGIPLEEVNAAITRLVHEDNTVIRGSGPEKPGLVPPDSEELLAAAREAAASNPPAYQDTLAATALMESPPPAGKVARRETREDFGATVLTFDNGVRVWLQPTDYKDDQILFGAQGAGGTSLADTADLASAELAGAYVSEAGVGGFTPTDLQKLLSGKVVQVSPFISTFTEGLRGGTTPGDLETALQDVYLSLTAPNDRPQAFGVLIDRYRAFLQNRLANPMARFGDAAARINSGDNVLFQPPSLAWLDRARPGPALAFYRARMAEAPAWDWFFVGNFDPEAVEPLLARYLGSLPPAPGGKLHYEAHGLAFPAGVIDTTVFAGSDPKSQTLMSWPALTGNDEMEMYLLRKAGDVLEIRLRDILREELGSTYSVSVGGSSALPYPGYATTTVSFGSAPENAVSMQERVREEIARYQAGGPTDEEVGKVKEMELRTLQKNLEDNGYWLASLMTVDLLGWNPDRILARKERIDEITAPALQAVMKRYYPADNHTVITLMPAAGAGAGDDSSR